MFKIIKSGSFLLGISSFISGLMGIYRDHLLASSFGAGAELDAYFAAFKIPDLIYSLLVFSTISTVFLPYYLTVQKDKGQDEANKITSRVLNLVMLAIGSIALLMAIFAPYIINFYVHGFTPETKSLTVYLMRIMLFSQVLFAFSSIAISVQNASHKFFAQALGPILYNAGIILSVLFFVKYLGIKAIAWGVLLGSFMQFIIQVPSLYGEGFKWHPIFEVNDEIKKLIKMAIPRILSVGIYQLSITFDTFIATSLTAGSIAAINLAANIATLPLSVIVISISTTAFVHLSKQTSNNAEFLNTLNLGAKKIFYWLVPTLFGLYAISKPLINFLFLYGEFTIENANLTRSILMVLLLGIGFQGFLPLLNRAYFAMGNTVIPLYISVVSMIINIILSYTLAKSFGAVGIATGTAVGMLMYSGMLIYYTRKDFGKFMPTFFLIKVLISSLIMYFALFYLGNKIENLNSFLQILILSISGAILYLGMNGFRIKI